MKRGILLFVLIFFIFNVTVAFICPVEFLNPEDSKVLLSLDVCTKKSKTLSSDLSTAVLEPQAEIVIYTVAFERVLHLSPPLYKEILPTEVFKPPEA